MVSFRLFQTLMLSLINSKIFYVKSIFKTLNRQRYRKLPKEFYYAHFQQIN